MISNRPYLIRAIYEWIVDNNWTPHIQVDANYPGVNVPQEYVNEGMIVLNVSPKSIGNQNFSNEMFGFNARFAGIDRRLSFPPEAVLAVFARENGQGMPFPPEPYPEDLADLDEELASKPILGAVPDSKESESSADAKSSVTTGAKTDKPAAKKSPKKPAKKPTLTVVK